MAYDNSYNVCNFDRKSSAMRNCLLYNHVLKEIIKSPQYWCCDYGSTVVQCLINDLPGSDILSNHGDAAGSVIESNCYLSGVNAEKLGMLHGWQFGLNTLNWKVLTSPENYYFWKTYPKYFYYKYLNKKL